MAGELSRLNKAERGSRRLYGRGCGGGMVKWLTLDP